MSTNILINSYRFQNSWWNDCVLLTHMDGADESTTFTDASTAGGNSPHTLTATGTVQVDTAQSKFGGASGLFPGGTDVLAATDSDDFHLSTSDFTIDFWVRHASLTASQFYCSSYPSGEPYFIFYKDSTNILWFTYRSSGLATDLKTTSTPLSATTWHHIALVRSGATPYIFVDGVSQPYTFDQWVDMVNIGHAFDIGGASALGSGLNGHLDEFRFVRKAIWTSNFTPPTAPYSQFNP